jgi:sulfatase modifying factor 1
MSTKSILAILLLVIVSTIPCLNAATETASKSDGKTQLPSTIINTKDGTKLILIPAGEFIAGGEKDDEIEGPIKVNLPAFWIAETAVTNSQYKKFIDATGHRPPAGDTMPYTPSPAGWSGNSFPPGEADFPVEYISWEDAVAYCDWAGLRLPTELEWEKAARGTDGRKYPWGDNLDSNIQDSIQNHSEETCSVKDYPALKSPYGCFNMMGNVSEWCSNSPTLVGSYRILKGSSVSNKYDLDNYRCAKRNFTFPDACNGRTGFRCASVTCSPKIEPV